MRRMGRRVVSIYANGSSSSFSRLREKVAEGRMRAGQWARATQKSTASRSDSFHAESGKMASASRAMSP